MSNWIHRLFNPHCPHCKDEKIEDKLCSSCETLRAQLEIANYENKRLLDKILAEPKSEPSKPPPEITIPRNVPWSVRRQMLEAEDREKARLMREAPKPVPVEELEKELDIATAQRETEH